MGKLKRTDLNNENAKSLRECLLHLNRTLEILNLSLSDTELDDEGVGIVSEGLLAINVTDCFLGFSMLRKITPAVLDSFILISNHFKCKHFKFWIFYIREFTVEMYEEVEKAMKNNSNFETFKKIQF